MSTEAPEMPTTGDEISDEPLPETIAGRYKIRRLLGRGGFGAVYEAYDQLEARLVALKVIRHDISAEPGTRSVAARSLLQPPSSSISRYSDPLRKTALISRSFGNSQGLIDDATVRFKDEFRLLTQLHHPNLAAVYDFGRCDAQDSFFFTQELIHGLSLGEYLKGAPQAVVVEVFVQLARALDYIHTLGFVHEDIKPSNVLVLPPESEGAPPQAKIIDFGLARVLRRPTAAAAEEYEVHGTPGFSAPEKIRGESTDGRSDIYALAATLYTALRGQKPFPSRDFKEALRHQMDWRPEFAGALLPFTSPVIAELIGRMLEPDPSRRPQSARSIVLELLRRESAQIRGRLASVEDRREFARVLVEHLPFVDRAGYLDILLTRAVEILRPEAQARDLRPTRGRLVRTVVIEAPEGMGKHRLMAELRREVQLGDGVFVDGNCWSAEGSVGSLGPLVLQLATALSDRSAAVQRHTELVQAARDRRSDDAFSGQITEFLVRCAAERPFVLHLSELGRGGEAMRTTVEQLIRAIDHNEARILLCLTTEPNGRLRPTLDAVVREQLAELWQLRPFTHKEMQAVLQGILGDIPVLADLASMLEKLTGGHPLSFRETLRALIEESILVRDADSWVLRASSVAAEQLHKSLAQRSEARLDALGGSAWEVASILYLVEAPIDEDKLADLSDLRRERFRRTLDRLESEGLLIRNTALGSGVVALAHESVREAVRSRYGESLSETRFDLAERIAELGVHDPKLTYLRARLLDDAAAAGLESVDELERAADALIAASEPQLAADVLERLIARLRRYGRVAALPRLLSAMLALLEHAAGALDDLQREAAHYEAGVLVAELLGDYRAQSLFWLGLVDRFALDTARAGERALERLGRAGEAAKLARDRGLELRIANRRAEVLIFAGDIEEALRYSGEAMQLRAHPGASDVDILYVIGVRLRCLSIGGQHDEARRLHDEAQPIAARVPVIHRRAYLSGIAFLAVLSGDAARAIPETRQAIDELRLANTTRLLIPPLHNLGDLLLRSGEHEAAADAFREAIRLAGLHGYDFHVNLNRGFLGYTLARLGHVEEGAVMLADAKADMQQIQGEHMAVQQLRLLDAELAHLRGQSPRARRELEEMLADFESAKEYSLANWATEALGRIERDRGTTFIEAPSHPDDAPAAPDEDTVRTKPIR